ncbi:MAG: transglutaminase family protein [Verrucomicrobiota bacterium]
MTRPAEPATPETGTKLSVMHRTTFHYGMPVHHSLNTLHLEPRTFPYQKTLSSLIRVIPATRLQRFTDLFQNPTHHFELPDPHVKLQIESRLRVHNLPLDLTDEQCAATLQALDEPAVRERIWPYLQTSNRVSMTPDLWRQAVDITCGLPSVYGQANALMGWIHREFRYEPGSTGVKAHLEESFASKHGVCQDFTHIMLGLCRSLGVPARYASGYLYNGPKDSLVGAQASHAWCEVYLPGAGWIGFDPTNNTLADDRYVKIAVGRDYDDVAPVVGSYQGTAHCRLEVRVEVEKL